MLQFLEDQKTHVGFSGISTAKAALSSFITYHGKPLGQHYLVSQFMTGIARQLPRQPKYTEIWDPDQVLKFLKTWSPAKFLNLFQLSVKTVLLLLLVSGQRVQTMTKLSLDNMMHKRRTFVFVITENLKHSRGYAPATEVTCKNFPPDARLCIENYLKAYLKRTEKLRTSRALFVTTTKPHGAASQATLARWVRLGLQKSGINTQKYGPASTRAAATNKAFRQGVPIQSILQKASWSSKTTFTTWYKKPVEKPKPMFQEAVLSMQKGKK